jgi:hypothetical protein
MTDSEKIEELVAALETILPVAQNMYLHYASSMPVADRVTRRNHIKMVEDVLESYVDSTVQDQAN